MQPNDPNQPNQNPNPIPQPEPQLPPQQYPTNNPIPEPAQPMPNFSNQTSAPPQNIPQPNISPTAPPPPTPTPQAPIPSPQPSPLSQSSTPTFADSPQPPQPMQPQAPISNAPKKNFPIKRLLILLGAVFIIALLAIIAIIVVGRLNSNVPKYSETKNVELTGFSTDENSGMSFDIPTEMEETIKTDLSADYVHKEKSAKNSEGELGNINAAIETISYTEDVTDEQKKQIADRFNSESFDSDVEGSIGTGPKNIKISKKTVSDDNATLRAELTLEVPSTENKEKYVPAKGVISYKIAGKRMYLFIYAFTNEVFDANEGFIKKMEQSVKYGV